MLNRVPVRVPQLQMRNSKPREPNGGTGTEACASRVVLLPLGKAASHKVKASKSLSTLEGTW